MSRSSATAATIGSHTGAAAPLARMAGTAAVLATVLNLLLFLLGSAAGIIDPSVEVRPGMGPLEWLTATLLSLLPPFVAASVLALLPRALRPR